jgi:hypothetical protein
MSRRILMSLAMISGILNENPVSVNQVREIRNRIKDRLATEFGVNDHQTIQDKYTRQFGLRIDEFDQLVFNYAQGETTGLIETCLRKCVDVEDEDLVNKTLRSDDHSNDELAQEFGMQPSSRAFREGRVRLVLHKLRERDQSLVRDAKRIWFNEMKGDIMCYTCGFSFFQKYGDLGSGFIEAHHIIPINQLDGEYEITVSDLVPLCANCHRMIHRCNPMMSVDEFKLSLDG